jgi:hypothetical protein
MSKFAPLLILCLCLADSTTGLGYQGRNSVEVSAIDVYAKKVDSFIKRNRNRQQIFANVSNDDADRWREFKNERERDKLNDENNLGETALVWLKSRKVIGANFTFQSGSGDWVQYVMYYFRDDGSLAKIRAQLNTFHGNISVARDKYYSRSGRLLNSRTRYLALESQKPTKHRPDFMDEEIPLYQNVRRLPFYRLL